ncbi:MAG: antibiotic biosynthesis monooxygenase, partial [Halieaceae bacterium]|nr:antibiotic biosynthesis monooxygenase [Halieaceae bacterium]
MVWRHFLYILLLLCAAPFAAHAEDTLLAGPSAFVLIARLHALPGEAENVVALSSAVDEKV